MVKLKTLAWLGGASMMASCTTVYAVVPPGGLEKPEQLAAITSETNLHNGQSEPADHNGQERPDRFIAAGTLKVEGRLGHAQLAVDGTRKTSLLLELRAADAKPEQVPPTNTTLVIDSSGSMSGPRIADALAAAHSWIDRMPDGDLVSVVSFDDDATLLVPSTELTASSRASIHAQMRLEPAGSTCLSCGLSTAQMQHLPSNHIHRVIVLSDGEANVGSTRFETIAARFRDADIAVSTLGIGQGYNEATLSTLAFQSNGRHYFVSEPNEIAGVFAREAQTLRSTVASQAVAVIELPESMELARMHDRSFRRVGRRIEVPLGTFAAGQSKTVLLEVRAHGDSEDKLMANVHVRYRDATSGGDEQLDGALTLALGAQSSPLDPLVAMRLARSSTSQALEAARTSLQSGDRQAALQKLAEHRRQLRQKAEHARRQAQLSGDTRAADVTRDFERQDALAAQVSKRVRAAPSTRRARRHESLRTRQMLMFEME